MCETHDHVSAVHACYYLTLLNEYANVNATDFTRKLSNHSNNYPKTRQHIPLDMWTFINFKFCKRVAAQKNDNFSKKYVSQSQHCNYTTVKEQVSIFYLSKSAFANSDTRSGSEVLGEGEASSLSPLRLSS